MSLQKLDGQLWSIIAKVSSAVRIAGRLYNLKNQYYSLAT